MTLSSEFVQPYAAAAGALLVIVLSVRIMLQDRNVRKRLAAGELPEGWRHDQYVAIIQQLLLLGAIAILAWALSGRSFAEMGVTLGSGWRLWVSWTVVALIIGFLFVDFLRLVFRPSLRERIFRQLEQAPDLEIIRPRSIRECRGFQWLAVTAGIAEEIVYRGFLIAVLGFVLPLWAAALAAGALFVALHAYQGWRGMLKVAALTTLLTSLYWFGGSLLPVIVLHIAVDVIAGGMFALMVQARPTAQATA
ncbi:CPBP family intramembrane glutamic endopeptidase [Hyphobacterium sp.]|jgi:membrane protease YdiL (CAAX protease family)|uniref:CPBP family intramembrane glutamic endopeptidase n=1 Tax=Hyphobacterium sp. TaxID=2004662 RepID=UPI003BA996CC